MLQPIQFLLQYWPSRSFNVNDLLCDFLLVINSNRGPTLHHSATIHPWQKAFRMPTNANSSTSTKVRSAKNAWELHDLLSCCFWHSATVLTIYLLTTLSQLQALPATCGTTKNQLPGHNLSLPTHPISYICNNSALNWVSTCLTGVQVGHVYLLDGRQVTTLWNPILQVMPRGLEMGFLIILFVRKYMDMLKMVIKGGLTKAENA